MTNSEKVKYLENSFNVSFETIAKTITYCNKHKLDITKIKQIKNKQQIIKRKLNNITYKRFIMPLTGTNN